MWATIRFMQKKMHMNSLKKDFPSEKTVQTMMQLCGFPEHMAEGSMCTIVVVTREYTHSVKTFTARECIHILYISLEGWVSDSPLQSMGQDLPVCAWLHTYKLYQHASFHTCQCICMTWCLHQTRSLYALSMNTNHTGGYSRTAYRWHRKAITRPAFAWRSESQAMHVPITPSLPW